MLRLSNVRRFHSNDDMSCTKANPTSRCGAKFRPIGSRHDRADKVVGSISSLVATVDQGSFLTFPGTNTPQVCATATSANCSKSTDVTHWERYYASVLVLGDTVNESAVRAAPLKSTP